ncbi:putative NUDIX family hydrolase [Aspergillus uvarum CBS 121591]|uniref:Putative NUDIX family hydrolase n=1 Tax=Aspergillus uvarum CBS 121591 TaxID=1448315 RepID=A0A319CLU7_9EURO|nr:putative NUDIX family hydrolase [Aspergillus uvarum CBS 121591]PYH86164.1 putative NUDIX family hydrolase [Aspergillus uvarum CBS 121591]
MAKSPYDIVAHLDNFPYSDAKPTLHADLFDRYHALRVEGIDADLGYIPTTLVRRIPWPDKDWVVVDRPRAVVLMTPPETPASRSVRTQMMEAVVHRMLEAGCTEIRDGWRDERFPVYGPDGDVVFEIERSASAYFGVVTSGVQMLGYVVDDDGVENARIRLWIAKRSMRKQTYPGMLDCTAAGALAVGQTPRSTVMLEAAEEASIPSAVLKKGLRRSGCISYFHVKGLGSQLGGDGSMALLLPEVEYLYELQLDPGTVPRPWDGEVENFRLWDADQVLDALRRGLFKPNSAVAVIDFLLRHGLISQEIEPRYVEMVTRLHRRLPLPWRQNWDDEDMFWMGL